MTQLQRIRPRYILTGELHDAVLYALWKRPSRAILMAPRS